MKAYSFLFLFLSVLTVYSQDYKHHIKLASEAYADENMGGFLYHLQLANEARPNHEIIMYNLAAAYAINDSLEASSRFLQNALLINANLPFQEDPRFDKLIKDNENISELVQCLKKETNYLHSIYDVGEKDHHFESIVYDTYSNSLLLGSVNTRGIFKYDYITNTLTKMIAFEENPQIMSLMGMKIDPENNILWALSVETANMDMSENTETFRKSNLLKINHKTGEILDIYHSNDDKNHWFGDLEIVNGEIYISDSESNEIITLNKRNKKLEVVYKDDRFKNLQGLTYLENKNKLLIADYREGLFSFDIKTGNINRIINDLDKIYLKGIDGIYAYNNGIVAIFNGSTPSRVVYLEFDDSISKLKNFTYLVNNHKDQNDPGLGTLANNKFYYLMNGYWGNYNDQMNLKKDEVKTVKVGELKLTRTERGFRD